MARPVDPDGKRAVYHIREGVISPWGNEFTADDILWRIERGEATGRAWSERYTTPNGMPGSSCPTTPGCITCPTGQRFTMPWRTPAGP